MQKAKEFLLRKGFLEDSNVVKNLCNFFEECKEMKTFWKGKYCCVLGRDVDIQPNVLYQDFSTFVTSVLVKGVVVTPAPMTVLGNQIDEYLDNICDFKSVLPASVVSVIEQQERDYENSMGTMCYDHEYFFVETVVQNFSPLGNVSFLPINCEILPKEMILPYGLDVVQLPTEYEVESLELPPTDVVIYSTPNVAGYLEVLYDGLDRVSTYCSETGLSNEYRLPSWLNSKIRGFSVVSHSPRSMYPMSVMYGVECNDLKRIFLYYGTDAFRTVFDYGGYSENRDSVSVFALADKITIKSIKCKKRPRSDFDFLRVFGSYVSDSCYSFPWFDVKIMRGEDERGGHRIFCFKSGDEISWQDFVNDLRKYVYFSKLWHRLPSVKEREGGVFLSRLVCVEDNPGPECFNIFKGIMLWVLLVHMLSVSLYVYVTSSSFLPLVCVICVTSGVLCVMSIGLLCCSRQIQDGY